MKMTATCGVQKFRWREKNKSLLKILGVVNTGRPLQVKYWAGGRDPCNPCGVDAYERGKGGDTCTGLFECMCTCGWLQCALFARPASATDECRRRCIDAVFLPARRYASAATSYDPVSVCPCLCVCLFVCPSQVGLLSKWLRGVFGMEASFDLSYTVL